MGGVGLVVDQLAHLAMDLVGKAVVQIIRFQWAERPRASAGGPPQQSLNVPDRGGDEITGTPGPWTARHVDIGRRASPRP